MAYTPSFKPEFVDQARKLCDFGATDQELATFFDVAVRTIHDWKHRHPEFGAALKAGKDMADERMVRSLYQRGIGYTAVEKQAIKVKDGNGGEKVEIVEVEKHVPPSDVAIIWWLKNRRPLEWRDRQEIDINDARTMSDQVLEAKLAELVAKAAPRPH